MNRESLKEQAEARVFHQFGAEVYTIIGKIYELQQQLRKEHNLASILYSEDGLIVGCFEPGQDKDKLTNILVESIVPHYGIKLGVEAKEKLQ